MQVRTSSCSLGVVHWLGVDHGFGVVVRLNVGSGERVGCSDTDDLEPVSALEEVRVER